MPEEKWQRDPQTGAMRESLGTPYLRQIPLEAVAAGAASLEYGAAKYSNRNWEHGLPWQQLIDSLRRHLDDFERGHNIDNGPGGSGLPHVSMIMANAMMLSASYIRGIGDDNRLPATFPTAFNAKETAKWIEAQLQAAEEFKEQQEQRRADNT